MKENMIVRGWKWVTENTGKLFIIVVVISVLVFGINEMMHKGSQAPLTENTTTSTSTEMVSLGNPYLDQAVAANKVGDYQTGYDQATEYLTASSTTNDGKVQAYIARGEAEIHLNKCKDAVSDLYIAANNAPNDITLQSHISDLLNVIFYGKECEGKY